MKIYFDTSIISALFDDRNPERKILTKDFFRIADRYELYISEITLLEIHQTISIELKEKMIEAISTYHVLQLTDSVQKIAKQYIDYGAVPSNYTEDAYHIAIAVIHEMDYLLSWNFRHIVRKKTRDIVQMVNAINELKTIMILTPPELL